MKFILTNYSNLYSSLVAPLAGIHSNGCLLLQDFKAYEILLCAFIPVISYFNVETDKSIILSDNKGKARIYQWIHKESGKIYIGSAVDLSIRLKIYFSKSHLNRDKSMYIYKALLHYKYSAFSLSILEYIDISNLFKEDARKLILSKEQHYIDSLSPEYNIQKIAGSSLGQKRSEKTKTLIRKVKLGRIYSVETKTKISEALKGKTHSAETKAKMSLAKSGEKNPNFGKARSVETKAKMSATRGTAIFVYSEDDLLVNNFPSARQAGQFFNTDSKTILRYVRCGKIFRKKWILSTLKK